MISKLGYLTSSNIDYLIALAVGVLTAIFSKFILEMILPRPKVQDESTESEENSTPPDNSQKQSEESLNNSSDKNTHEELNE